MLFALFPIFLITASAVLIAACLRKPFSELFAPLLLFVMLTLYGFYIFDLLPLGRAVVTGLLCSAVILCAVLLVRTQSGRQHLLLTIKNPTFHLFLAAFLIFLIFAAGKIVNLWDSLRLWGAYPKVLHSTGALQMGSGSVLYPSMQSYPPGMPLLCYYITSFSPTFSESSLYLCYSLFGFALMLPLLEGAGLHGKSARYAAFIGILFIPWLLTSVNYDYAQYYSSLFIDMPLGICAGYTFYQAFRRLENNLFHTIIFSLSCACLALLKDSGSFISLCCILGAAISCMLRRNGIPPVRYLPTILAPSLVLAFVWCSWDYLRDVWCVSNHLRLDLVFPSAGEIVRMGYRFLITPATTLLFPFGAIDISLPFALLTIFSLKLLLCKYTQRSSMTLELVDLGIQVLCYGGFFIGYCLIFMENIRTGEYPSYPRYMSTILLCALYIFSADCIFRYHISISHFLQTVRAFACRKTPHGKMLHGILKLGKVALIASLILGIALTMLNREHAGASLYVSARNTADAVSAAVPSWEEGTYTDVYLVIPGEDRDNYRLHHRIYFELIDDGIRVKSQFDEMNISAPELGYTPDSFMEHLTREGFDYVVLTWTDDDLSAEFGTLFPDQGNNLIYKIDHQTATLIPIPAPTA